VQKESTLKVMEEFSIQGKHTSFYKYSPGTFGHILVLPLMRTTRLPLVDWADAPADLKGLVRFAERRNLVCARVPSHFKRSLLDRGACSASTLRLSLKEISTGFLV
jgi:hypothetical protein